MPAAATKKGKPARIPTAEELNKRAVFWFDTETTGVDPEKNAITQLGALIEINGEIKEELNIKMKPFFGAEIKTKALSVNKTTRDIINNYPDWEIGFEHLVKTLKKYVDPYNRFDKFTPAGFNVTFDINFLRKYFDYMYGDKTNINHIIYFNTFFFLAVNRCSK